MEDDLKPGQTIVVAPDSFGDCVTFQKKIDDTRFSIGEEDLRVAGGPVTGVDPATNQIVCPIQTYFARPGMTVINSRLEPQGRVTGPWQPRWTLDRTGYGPLSLQDFPPEKDGAAARYAVVVAGPGDEVWIPDLVEYGK
jgi:hypothetical protein